MAHDTPHSHGDHPPGCDCCGGQSADHGPRPPVSVAPRPWRPVQAIRVLSIAVIAREGQILCGPVYDDSGQIKGWRPLGGAVEFGESAVEALRREFLEETGQELSEIKQIAAMENVFEHHGAPGHEVVFVHKAKFANPELYAADQLACLESNGEEFTAKWITLAKAQAGRIQLFPEGLADLL